MKLSGMFIGGVLLLLILMSGSTYSQNRKKADFKQLIESKNYVFVAEAAIPMGGGIIQLISPYDVKLKNDSLISELPYFGTAYSAPIGSSGSPLSFVSTDFEHQTEVSGKGNFMISIKFRSPNDPNQFNLSISESGYGTLVVSSTHRQAITFNGYIKAVEKNKL